ILSITLIEKDFLLRRDIKNLSILFRNRKLNLRKNRYLKLKRILKEILILKKFKSFKKNLILSKLLLILLLLLLENNRSLSLIL
ncbi:hypothetical protein GQ607_016373, partial [Colletotrichum asianum]